NNLNAVTAISATDAWAVGTEDDTTIGTQLLILHWDGKSWNFASAPHPTGTSTLMSVSALNNHMVFAVGVHTNGPVTSTALIEQWNGTHWSIDTTPQPPISGLNGVAIGSSSSALAVGRVRTNTGTDETLTEFFNGSFWHIVPSPNRGAFSTILSSVDFANTHEAWAVGKTTASNAQNNVLVLHWNGSGWNVVSAPNKGVASQFNAVAVDHMSGVAWGVGYYKPTTNTLRTLVERSC
ncbi:MAG: hypothetical protein H0U76_20430, partial [Ktedonobacteraceae bacterium]|nr:hypothetical protein [Ktedonobacteraceae bacterium]